MCLVGGRHSYCYLILRPTVFQAEEKLELRLFKRRGLYVTMDYDTYAKKVKWSAEKEQDDSLVHYGPSSSVPFLSFYFL